MTETTQRLKQWDEFLAEYNEAKFDKRLSLSALGAIYEDYVYFHAESPDPYDVNHEWTELTRDELLYYLWDDVDYFLGSGYPPSEANLRAIREAEMREDSLFRISNGNWVWRNMRYTPHELRSKN